MSPKQNTTTPFSVTDILSPLDESYGPGNGSVVDDSLNNSRRELHYSYANMEPGSVVVVSAGIHVPNLGGNITSGSSSPPMSSLYRQSMSINSPTHHGVHHHHHQQMTGNVPYQGMNTAAAAAVAAGMNGNYNLHSMAPAPQSAFHSLSGAGAAVGYCNTPVPELPSYNNVQAATAGWYGSSSGADPRFGTMPSKYAS